jgi:hypothetical protein
LNLPDNSYLSGLWQTEKYFKDCEEIIRTEFTFKQPLNKKNSELSETIRRKNSVSIHIRRGDYIYNSEEYKIHGLCSIDYYKKAVECIANKAGELTLFIFSDDIEWVKNNLKFDFPIIFVDNNVDDIHEDLRLMSLCKHNIIANSTFSWWGAWLNNNKEKIVIAPKKWFNEFEADTKDIYPDSWMRI